MNQRHPYISTCVVCHLQRKVKQGLIVHTKKKEQQVHTAVFAVRFTPLHTSRSIFHACQPNQAPELAALAELQQAPLGYRPLGGWVGKRAEIAEKETELSFWKASQSVTKYDLHNLRQDKAVYFFFFYGPDIISLSKLHCIPAIKIKQYFESRWSHWGKISEVTFQVPTLINYNHN